MSTFKLLYVVTTGSYFFSHRLGLALAAQKAGYTVAVATNCSHKEQAELQKKGIIYFPCGPRRRRTLNVFQEITTLYHLSRLIRHFQPDIIHTVALKPLVYINFLHLGRSRRLINALGGLGHLYTGSRLYQRILRKICNWVLWACLKWTHSCLLLQNQDDQTTLVQAGVVTPHQTYLIAGAGVDIHHFQMTPLPQQIPLRVAVVARLLRDKGIVETVTAARILKRQGAPIVIELYGLPDKENPSHIPVTDIQAWHDQGLIVWHGHCDDIASVYAQSDVALLASYREGLPKSLLEAAACGRPIITTDVPGCREVVDPHENGVLIPARDAQAIVTALTGLIQDRPTRIRWGQRSREIALERFADYIIYEQTLALYLSSRTNPISQQAPDTNIQTHNR